MPSEMFRHMSDADVEAIVAYLRSQPALGPNTPPTRLNVLVAFFVGLGLARPAQHPSRAPSSRLLKPSRRNAGSTSSRFWVARVSRGELHGRPGQRAWHPPGPNLRLILLKWNAQDFADVADRQTRAHRKLAEGMPSSVSDVASDGPHGDICVPAWLAANERLSKITWRGVMAWLVLREGTIRDVVERTAGPRVASRTSPKMSAEH
jgi:hypothetical protein